MYNMPHRATFYRWDKEVGKYGALAGRAHTAWRKIERFCQQHHPTMLRTLRQVFMHTSHSSESGALHYMGNASIIPYLQAGSI